MVVVWGIAVAAGLDGVLSALVLSLMLAAAVPLGITAANIARQLPGPLGALGQGALVATEAAIRVMVAPAEAAGGALASVIQAPWQAIWTDMRAIVVATEHLYWAQNRTRTVTVPRLQGWTWGELVRVYQGAIAYADAIGARDLAYARQLAGAAMQRADQEFAQANAYARALAVADQRYAFQLAQAAEQRADLETAQANRFTEATAGAVAAYAAALAAQGIAYTQQVGLEAERLAEGIGATSLDYTRTVAGDLLREIDRARAQSAAATATAVGAVAVSVRAIEDSPCQRFCSPLGDLGSLLQGLEDAGLLALMLELVSEAMRHPDAVAGVIEGAVAPLVRDAAHSLQLGIP